MTETTSSQAAFVDLPGTRHFLADKSENSIHVFEQFIILTKLTPAHFSENKIVNNSVFNPLALNWCTWF